MSRRMSHWLLCLTLILIAMVGMTLTASAETKALEKDVICYKGDTVTWEGSKYVRISNGADTETESVAGGFKMKGFNGYTKEQDQWKIKCFDSASKEFFFDLTPSNGETGTPSGIKFIGGTGTAEDPLTWELYYPVQTEAVKYNKATVNEINQVTYAEQTSSSYTLVTEDMTLDWPSGWYVAKGTVTINNSIDICGEANLILCDGCTLTVSDDIELSEGNTLNIYGQSEGTGELAVAEGIGRISDGKCGNVTIHGGTVTATGSRNAAGIGGEYQGDGGDVMIYGGTVTATGSEKAAGIGGGTDGDGGDVTVYGGTVTAAGGEYAAGIGGGFHDVGNYDDGGDGGDVVIYGGTVTATGGENAAGIGGGLFGDGGAVTIYGGMVTATGGGGAAGIGGGANAVYHGILTIKNNLNVYGGDSKDLTDRLDRYYWSENESCPRYMIITSEAPTTAAASVSVFTYGKNTYTVTSEENGTVSFTKAANKKTVKIPKTVKYNGRTYSVTGIKAKAFKGKKTRTIIVKTKKLTKKSVRRSLKGSKVKTIKVKVGKKKANKKYVKKYKKIFTKKNAGKKVKIK